ncbi:hypothetical protein BDZ45DRAFT_735369 [Acephala macrosclerotiorum]|nr:hypothetical protein BDZ45DRAFT_735369 [Acephala macrosclerotiorum]
MAEVAYFVYVRQSGICISSAGSCLPFPFSLFSIHMQTYVKLSNRRGLAKSEELWVDATLSLIFWDVIYIDALVSSRLQTGSCFLLAEDLSHFMSPKSPRVITPHRHTFQIAHAHSSSHRRSNDARIKSSLQDSRVSSLVQYPTSEARLSGSGARSRLAAGGV